MTDSFARARRHTAKGASYGAEGVQDELEALLDGADLKAEDRVLFKPGEYNGYCEKAKLMPFYRFGGVVKLVLHFQVYALDAVQTPENCLGRLEMIMPTPYRIDRETKRVRREEVSRRSRVFQAYRVAVRDDLGLRPGRIAFRKFEGKLYRVVVGTVTPRENRPGEAPYSVVRDLLERLA